MPAPEYRLGIDVGGTNTNAVIMDPADRVVAKAEVPSGTMTPTWPGKNASPASPTPPARQRRPPDRPRRRPSHRQGPRRH